LKAQGKDPVFNLTFDFATNRQIGHGALSVVKKCTHNKTGYEVALKTYEKKRLTRKSELMAIHREIFILAGLEHPNLMKLFEVIDTKTHVNLLVELCHGQSLFDYVKRYGSKGKFGGQGSGAKATCFISESATKNIFREIATGVAHLHELGLVHRGLTTDHVMIDDQGTNVKIIDFGSATSFQPNDKLAALSGTP